MMMLVFTVKVHRRLGGLSSGIPSAPSRRLFMVVRSFVGAWRFTIKSLKSGLSYGKITKGILISTLRACLNIAFCQLCVKICGDLTQMKEA